MIARSFKSVIWVGAVGTAALGCYMVSLQVATERAELARVEAQIVSAKRDIRALQTELGTRGRLSQLEHWNAEVLALSAPTAAQYIPDEVTLARFDQSEPTLEERGAQVRMASAEVGPAPAAPAAARPAAPVVQAVAAAPAAAKPIVQRASFAPPAPAQASAAVAKPKPAPAAAAKAPLPEKKAQVAKAEPKPADSAKKPETKKPDAKPAAAAKSAGKAAPEKKRASKIDGKLAAELRGAAKKPQGSGGN